jgi:acetyl esterase/lipase
MRHAPDPEAIRPTSPDAIAYGQTVEEWGREAPEPDLALSYGEDRGQRLEIFLPSHASNAPVLLFLHGGAWIDGHLGWLSFMARPVTQAGFILAAATYRLAPRCKWPAQFDDVAAAFELVHGQCRQWGGDDARIIIGGHSAGGHLAALLAARAPHLPIAACFPVSASLDLRYGDVPLDSGAGRVYRYLFADRSQDGDASPLAFVKPGLPPFQITWGERDLTRVARSGAKMVKALQDCGSKVGFAIEPGADHFATHTMLRDSAHPWFDRLAEAAGWATPERTRSTIGRGT